MHFLFLFRCNNGWSGPVHGQMGHGYIVIKQTFQNIWSLILTDDMCVSLQKCLWNHDYPLLPSVTKLVSLDRLLLYKTADEVKYVNLNSLL